MQKLMVLALALLGGSAWLSADEIILQNGNVIIGKATYLDDGKLKVAVSAPSRYREHTAREVEMTFAGSEVKQIRHSSSLFEQAQPWEKSEKALTLDGESPLPALDLESGSEKPKKTAPRKDGDHKPAAVSETSAEKKTPPAGKPAASPRAQLQERLEKLLAGVAKDPVVTDAKAAVKEMEANLAAKKAEHEHAQGEAAQRLAGEVDDLGRALEDTKRNYQERLETKAATVPEIVRLRKKLADMEEAESGTPPTGK